jgi:hypothetical protein
VEIQSADAKALVAWKLKSTIGNLKEAVDFVRDAGLKERLARSVSALEVLAGQP